MTAPTAAAVWTVALPWRPESKLDGPNARSHWAAKSRRNNQIADMIGALLRFSYVPRDLKITGGTVTFAVEQRQGPLPDGDNQKGMLKHCRDAVARFLNVDDADGKPLAWEYRWQRGAADRTLIELRLETSA